MLRRRWVIPMAVVAVAAAGCSSTEDAPDNGATVPSAAPALPAGVSGTVSGVPARCGVQGVFWQNNWWVVDPPIQAVKNQSSISTVTGTMTTIGNNQARLDSPDLNGPQTLSMEAGRTEKTPPFVACAPTAPVVQ